MVCKLMTFNVITYRRIADKAVLWAQRKVQFQGFRQPLRNAQFDFFGINKKQFQHCKIIIIRVQ